MLRQGEQLETKIAALFALLLGWKKGGIVWQK